MATTTKHATLVQDLYAIGIHGQTGQETEEGTLAAGALIRDVTSGEGWAGTEYQFLASTDGGRLWYRQKSYSRPKTD